MQQLLHGCFIAPGHTRFEFVAARSKACASHQVSHETDVFLVSHTQASLLIEMYVTLNHTIIRTRCRDLAPDVGKPSTAAGLPQNALWTSSCPTICLTVLLC